MKHKKLFRSVTALLAALVLMGGFFFLDFLRFKVFQPFLVFKDFRPRFLNIPFDTCLLYTSRCV